MRAFDVGREERVLFVFTHPDDELTLSAFISRLVKSGIHVHICWIHSTPVREAESRKAMGALGLDQANLTFFCAKDGALVDEIAALKPLLREHVERTEPTRVVTNAFEQGHLDHDATNLMVNMCFEGPVFEVPLYHTYVASCPRLAHFSDPTGEEFIELTPVERKTKKRLVRMYPSQTVRRNVVLYQLVHTLSLRRPPLFLKERLRLQTHKDFLAPNHPPAIAKRVAASAKWKRWVAAVRNVL
ncbi:MAG: PIG-L family deacetylase [Fimbriimonadaceae bacterium]